MNVITHPLILLGEGLRNLSLSGNVGNIIAIILYVGICVLPLIFVIRKKWRKENLLLPVLSGTLAYGLYYLINPGLMSDYVAGEIGSELCIYAIYSVLVAWIVLRVSSICENNSGKSIYRVLKVGMLVWMVMMVGFTLPAEVKNLVKQVKALQESNIGIGMDLSATYGVYGLRFVIAMVELTVILITLFLASRMFGTLEKESFSDGAKKKAEKMTTWCKRGLVIIVLADVIKNVVQLLLYKALYDIRIELKLPLLEITILLVTMALCRLLGQGKKLKDDNDMFV